MWNCPKIELSAQARVLFEQRDVKPTGGKMNGSGQSANPAAYDCYGFAHLPAGLYAGRAVQALLPPC